ncbi:tail protein [Escherichia phage SZH-1]|uniref:tail protein n=1 Tax=Escherichia phage SZH-1 TaxID=2945916 RepID=UPI0021895FFC|nr:tail protein [Escherichia phage SZH-1]URG18186.1 tail protein [Escherichia phage SZH-1]
MAIVIHYTRNEDGTFTQKRHNDSPLNFVVNHIPDGVPFRVFLEEIGEDNDVTEDFDALKQDAVFHVLEGAGGGVIKGVMKVFSIILKPLAKLLTPSTKGASNNLANQQADSPNNSLTDRNNKARPYERTYDICGRVQTIPNNLMTTYKVFDNAGRIIEYGFYDAGRGYLDVKAEDITDGDTKVQEITGTSVAVYAPYTSPNNTSSPQILVGEPIGQGLYITIASNEVDGVVLKAPNDLANNVGNSSRARLVGATGTVTDPTGDSAFNTYISPGDQATFTWIRPEGGGNLDGVYTVLSVDEFQITVDASPKLSEWQTLPDRGGGIREGYVTADKAATIGPTDTYSASLTDWVSLNRIPVERVVANFAAANGMFKDDGNKQSASATIEVQYQLIGDDGGAYGPIYTKQGTISGRSSDYTGVTVYADLPVKSKVRVRCRRVSGTDRDFSGTVSDEVSYINLYGQSVDRTPHYGNRTTVHSARKQTPRAAEVKQPQLRMVVTEMVHKYLGNGVFDSVRTPNTQAVQSLIRLARDPDVGALNLTTANMDKLLAVQNEIESYFGSASAGEFCYTFDDYKTTMQDIVTTIAEAIFCTPYRRGADILLDFERPRIGPEMVFTHRSKTTATEKWTRTFNDSQVYDSLKFSYIDPNTNVKETISIPAEGGVNTETYDSKGIRNYRQAYWAAYRRYQKNLLKKVTVSFTATEEGVFAMPGRAVSVVKGSRMAPQDGYIVAVNGLTLTLSQPVTFTPGDDHSLILKKRDGGVQSVAVVPGSNEREVVMLSAPQEAIYTGNSALKTEFSFGNEARHNAQMILVSTVDPGDDRTVKITGINYEADFYKYDGVAPFGRGFSGGFSNGFS